MKKKIGYIIVIFLIISIIFRLLNLFGTEIKSDSTFGNIILLIAQIASALYQQFCSIMIEIKMNLEYLLLDLLV